MPTKKQLSERWASEFEYPETRHEDDPMYRKPKISNPTPTKGGGISDDKVLMLMNEGYVLYSTHPYTGGKKFIARLEKGGIEISVIKKQFLRLLSENKIIKTESGTNRQYVYAAANNQNKTS